MALSPDQIIKLTHDAKGQPRKGVKVIAVQNFLGSMGGNKSDNYGNAEMDTRLYGWNAPTRNAIYKGIGMA
jgi:hypothetical protein